jgi:hypothetical protein
MHRWSPVETHRTVGNWALPLDLNRILKDKQNGSSYPKIAMLFQSRWKGRILTACLNKPGCSVLLQQKDSAEEKQAGSLKA